MRAVIDATPCPVRCIGEDQRVSVFQHLGVALVARAYAMIYIFIPKSNKVGPKCFTINWD